MDICSIESPRQIHDVTCSVAALPLFVVVTDFLLTREGLRRGA